ncbi:hypothetical protein [Pseudofrankia sp. DC12]|uniref:hypothetical protein n=1 Tax=Pseudofrankia sp. DC12 TaxID=683315 RepID=UPI00069645F5|nr:hypothetical protein [Pseudofrankia sp. DC12]
MRLTPSESTSLELTPLATYQCGSAHCPAVYAPAGHSDDLVVQGWIAGPHLAQSLPTGEQMVVLPRETLLEAVRKLLNEG